MTAPVPAVSAATPTRPERWVAPWTPEQVDVLNAMQADGRFYGYTCPGERECSRHGRMLTATPDGWICNCGLYRQAWAHALPTEDPTTEVTHGN